MKVIVVAHPKDDHAEPIQWALERAGYRATCWSGVSWTKQEQASLLLNQTPTMLLGELALERGDAIWLRQPDRPEQDQVVSETSEKSGQPAYGALFDAAMHALEALPVGCINRYSASRLIRNKGVQLRLAGASGLRIPETLISNSSRAVRDFFDRYPSNAICKPFAGHIWQQQGSEDVAVTETFSLTREQLPSEDEVFTYAPAIYQQMVLKQFDVRMVLMGERIYSFALRTPGNSLDWRYEAARRNLAVEIVSTPPDVEAGMRLFAQKAGICFGVMDFAVDRNGDWWFLEINEQGQFLWLDLLRPQAGLLQKFCAFLTAPQDAAGQLEERQDLFPSLAEYEQSREKEEPTDVTAALAGVDCKSMEPSK